VAEGGRETCMRNVDASVGFPQPRVLPPDTNVLVVASIPDIGAVAITKFQRLVFCNSNCTGTPEARVLLSGERVFDTSHARSPSNPEIAVQRDPDPRLEVVAQVSFKGSHRLLRLRPPPGITAIV